MEIQNNLIRERFNFEIELAAGVTSRQSVFQSVIGAVDGYIYGYQISVRSESLGIWSLAMSLHLFSDIEIDKHELSLSNGFRLVEKYNIAYRKEQQKSFNKLVVEYIMRREDVAEQDKVQVDIELFVEPLRY